MATSWNLIMSHVLWFPKSPMLVRLDRRRFLIEAHVQDPKRKHHLFPAELQVMMAGLHIADRVSCQGKLKAYKTVADFQDAQPFGGFCLR